MKHLTENELLHKKIKEINQKSKILENKDKKAIQKVRLEHEKY